MEKFLSIFSFLMIYQSAYAFNISGKTCVALTQVDNICVTPKELKSYYEKYKKEKITEVGKGNWYFTLADLIDATELLTFEKILLHEAKKSGVEKTGYFDKRKLNRSYKEINNYTDNLLKEGKITKKDAKLLREKLKKAEYYSYLKKAFLEKELSNYMKVTTDDIEQFMGAHKGKYGFKKDPEHPNMKIISKKDLVKMIKAEKQARVADEFSKMLWKKYKVKIDNKLLKELDSKLNGVQ